MQLLSLMSEGWELFIVLSTCVIAYLLNLSSFAAISLFLIAIKLKPLLFPQSLKFAKNSSIDNNIINLSYGNILEFAKIVFGYEVIDHSNTANTKEKILYIGYHSRTTLDSLFFMASYQTSTVIHELLCDVPLIGDFLTQVLGALPSKARLYDNQAEGKLLTHLLAKTQPVYLLPGGQYECLKYSYESNTLLWKPKAGFVRFILKHRDQLENIHIIPIYTKNCENMYYVIPNMHDFVSNQARTLTESVRQGHYYIIPYAFTILIVSVAFLAIPTCRKVETHIGKPIIFTPTLQTQLVRDKQDGKKYSKMTKVREGEQEEVEEEEAVMLTKHIHTQFQTFINTIEAIPSYNHAYHLIHPNNHKDNYTLVSYIISLLASVNNCFKLLTNILILLIQNVLYFATIIVICWVIYLPCAIVVFVIKRMLYMIWYTRHIDKKKGLFRKKG